MKSVTLPPTHLTAISHIRRFYQTWSFPSAVRHTERLFQKALSGKAWRPANPWDAVQLCHQLKKLSKAAFLISGTVSPAFSEVITVGHTGDAPDVSATQHYQGNLHQSTPFACFPRQLRADEFRFPSRALGRYCRCRSKKQWKRFYRELARCTLSSSSLQEYNNAGRLLRLRLQVFKLLEATHLIYVRMGKIPIAGS